MSSYHGGKQRIGLEIAENIHLTSTMIEDHTDFTIKGYCEPFCGMLGVYRHIPALFADHKPKLKYKAGDTNKSVIKMWQRAQKGWKPPKSCTEAYYEKLRKQTRSSAERGFIGHQYSYGGQYFRGFAGKYGKNTSQPDAANRVVKIAANLPMVEFSAGSYTQFLPLVGYVIYCDPPYAKRNEYFEENGDRVHFDNEVFWLVMQYLSQNNIVFISEYEAPKDFKLISSHNHHVFYGHRKRHKDNRERLFVHERWTRDI